MRTPLKTLSTFLLTFALLAAACSDDPAAEEIIENLTNGTDPVDDPPLDGFEIPDARAPEVDNTPLPVDGDYRIGVLDNGLTYMLRSNDTPGGSLDLRLVVNAGALQQPVAEDGSAHFLEHMLFNGTEAFPGNELTTQLQRHGIRFGADVNAYTSYDETVYFLGAPTSDAAAPTVAFDVLREWASRATIEPAEVDAEIGVVRDELRQRGESVQGIINAKFSEIYTRGTPYEGHDPIGEAELIESTTADTLREFYETWYRPDLMAIVVVGDVPLDRLEEEITSRFADLPAASADAPARDEVTVDLSATPVTEVIVHPDNGANFISIDVPLPTWDRGTVGGERMHLVEQAVAAMLDTRLNEAFQRGDLAIDQSPHVNAGFAENRAQRFYGTNFQSDDLEVGLNDYMSHLLLAAADGFTDDDVARVQAQLIAAIEDERATLGSIQDFQYADALTANYLPGSDLDIAARRLSRQGDAVETLTVDELTNYWRWLLQSSGPVVIAVTDDPDAVPTADAMAEVLANARPATQGAAAVEIEQLMTAPEAAEVVSTDGRTGGYSDVAEWHFANGVVVTHQQTEITDGSFDIWVESTGGWSTIDGGAADFAGAAVSAVLQSGVGPHDTATLQRYLESRDVSLFAGIEEWFEGLYGSASTSDAEDLFALMHLTMTEPRVDDVALGSVARGQESANEIAETDADVRQNDLLLSLLNDGDPRYETRLTQLEIDALDAGELLDLFAARFSAIDELHVAIVGDIAANSARDLAARYFGTLPTRPADTWRDLGIEIPSTAVSGEVELTDGTADGGLSRFDWIIGDPSAKQEVTSVVLATIITNRITETIREELGASYGGFASISVDREGPGALGAFIQVDGDPARLDEIRGALDTILAELAASGPTADEFDRAISVTTNDYNFVNDQTFLVSNIATTRHPDADVLLDTNRGQILLGLTAGDVRALVAALFADAATVEVAKVLP